jgi:CheY-like chemotaxis protein
MAIPVLICDDSSVARKLMTRSLPSDWDIDISYAVDGSEALDQLKAGKGDILFLDLNMPVMDGYETLEAIVKNNIQTTVLVVSGDIQPEAYNRVMALGAVTFIKKPIGEVELTEILQELGLHQLIIQTSTMRLLVNAANEKSPPLVSFNIEIVFRKLPMLRWGNQPTYWLAY